MRVTESEIKRLIHQSNLIEGYDDKEMDAQGLIAWRYLLDLRIDHLLIGDICKVQKIITLTQTDLRPDWRGYTRKIPVWIGGEEAMHYSEIHNALQNWLITLTFTVPQTAHVQFEKIHPFVDGNGRTGRLLMWWQQMKRDEPLTKLTAANRQEYYKWFK